VTINFELEQKLISTKLFFVYLIGGLISYFLYYICFTYFTTNMFLNIYQQITDIISGDFFIFFYFFYLVFPEITILVAILLGLFSIFFIFFYFTLKFKQQTLKFKQQQFLFLRKQQLIRQANYTASLNTFQK